MKIFIDFDDTLFYTKKFRSDLIAIFLKNGITESEFETAYQEALIYDDHNGQNCYDPERHIRILAGEDSGLRDRLIEDFSVFMENLSQYVFPDSYDFLQTFDRKDLFLLSFGDKFFQKAKVIGSGLEKYFERIIITTEKKMAVIRRMREENWSAVLEEIYFIDDRPEQMEKLNLADRLVHTMHIRRPESRYSKRQLIGGDQQIADLPEAEKIILSGKML